MRRDAIGDIDAGPGRARERPEGETVAAVVSVHEPYGHVGQPRTDREFGIVVVEGDRVRVKGRRRFGGTGQIVRRHGSRGALGTQPHECHRIVDERAVRHTVVVDHHPT
jgi:hypothetical protein